MGKPSIENLEIVFWCIQIFILLYQKGNWQIQRFFTFCKYGDFLFVLLKELFKEGKTIKADCWKPDTLVLGRKSSHHCSLRSLPKGKLTHPTILHFLQVWWFIICSSQGQSYFFWRPFSIKLAFKVIDCLF